MPAAIHESRPNRRGVEVRERVLRTAWEAFSREGFRACSLARIAADAGLSQAGLLHHFPTKEDLLLAVLRWRDELELDQVGRTLPTHTGLSVLSRLLRLVEINVELTDVVRSFTVLSAESVSEGHPARDWFRARYTRVRAAVADALQSGVDSGEIRAGTDCHAVATEVCAVMDGLQLQWLLDPGAVDMVALFRDYARRLDAALRNPAREAPDTPDGQDTRDTGDTPGGTAPSAAP
ncbi:transcriptional regulator, TetR family [Streptoalloteichus tenebrarius]|uniref:Transcriptional regulator, TetR family n=1 Tax=Streptoalloteichus tenebrarius (strain ATCC 17920 / DSM 40477 / JCM 4838 / CBS 697.72 / NBRC 16177 / NCIMB 11028 / NRRL B-12390 / A12253. 1 / ISP 5477) TaxID=1933 RepID=A0ABT1HUP6_STRSD|nr:TetR/AcrR family transcriptional regulator [Streptoalloteichus tenebrarius]MCP2259221.1 transcriptional regulator, TetR family [Streptoalloteichus tenebrarius]BFF04297.1 hypothetical protein GCM10020241_59720 [Streptoalloteichus tenebrarius]